MKFLVAYDKNTSTANVLDEALKRARQEKDAHVYLVRTCKQETNSDKISQLEQRMNAVFDEVFAQNGVKGEVHILIRGLTAGEDVVQYAREKNVDEIIIGIKKKSKIGKLMFGSTAQFILLEADCPVLSVK